MKQQDVSFLAFSCLHVPQHDPAAVDWLIEQVGRERPDYLIHLGDGIESNAASRWDDAREAEWTLKEEFDGHNAILKRLRQASPKSTRIFLPGNHETNLARPGRIDPRIRALCDWHINQPELVAHWRTPAVYDYCRRRGCWRLGQVVFAHGYEAGSSADEFQALHFADEYGLYVGGHTHRPTPEGRAVQCAKTRAMPLRYWYANVGCLRRLDPGYMERSRKMMWGQACAVGRCVPLKSPRQKCYWSVDVRTFRMYDEWASAYAEVVARN